MFVTRDFLLAKKKFSLLLNQREVYWKQQVKVEWLREGNRNTKFFHAKALKRRRQNNLERLLDNSGIWCAWNSSLPAVFTNYFENLYASQQCDSQAVLNYVPRIHDGFTSHCAMPYTL